MKKAQINTFEFVFVTGIMIDAHLLCLFRVDNRVSKSFIVNSLESNTKSDISLYSGLVVFDEARRSTIPSFSLGLQGSGI